MAKKSIVARIDFKTTQEKKTQMQLKAQQNGVTLSYLMNNLVDSYLQGESFIVKRKEFSSCLVRLLQDSQCISDEEVRTAIQMELEEMQCLI